MHVSNELELIYDKMPLFSGEISQPPFDRFSLTKHQMKAQNVSYRSPQNHYNATKTSIWKIYIEKNDQKRFFMNTDGIRATICLYIDVWPRILTT